MRLVGWSPLDAESSKIFIRTLRTLGIHLPNVFSFGDINKETLLKDRSFSGEEPWSQVKAWLLKSR